MFKGILVIVVLVYFELKGFKAKPVEDVSYIEGINFQYKEGKWTCGDVECPASTFGCKIVLKTDQDDRKVLLQSFNCIDKTKNVILGAGDRIDLAKEKIIDIDLETYIGAESVYSTGYGLGGHENAKGVISPGNLNDLKASARQNKKIVDDSNSS